MTDRKRRRISNRIRRKPSKPVRLMLCIVAVILVIPNLILFLTL